MRECSPSLSSTEQNLRSEKVHITEQLQDVEEEKDDSNEEENKDNLVDDEDEKEDLGYEEEAEEEEEDGPAAGVDEEKNEAQDPEPPREAREDEGPGEVGDDSLEQPGPAGTEAVGDSLRQRRSQHADKGPSAWGQCFKEYKPKECVDFPFCLQFKPNSYFLFEWASFS